MHIQIQNTEKKKIVIQNFFYNLAKRIKYPCVNVYQTPLISTLG